MPATLTKKPISSTPAKAQPAPIIDEILVIADELTGHFKKGCFCALRIGLRLMVLHRATGETKTPGGFRAALDSLKGRKIAPATAYRWINAAANAVCMVAKAPTIEDLELPEIGTKDWQTLEGHIQKITEGFSLQRLLIGSSGKGDEHRLDTLLQHSEEGDKLAEEVLDQVAKGELTLVQAIRSLAGKKSTKEKHRKDPVYLDIDGKTGEPKGLFCKSIITVGNTFSRWDQLDPAARAKVKASWKELVANLPKDLR